MTSPTIWLLFLAKLKNWATSWQNQQNDLCAQRRLISLGICPVWSESSLSTRRKWVLSYPLSAQRRLIRLGRCPGLHWAHMPFCRFCYEAAQRGSHRLHNILSPKKKSSVLTTKVKTKLYQAFLSCKQCSNSNVLKLASENAFSRIMFSL